jgi:hypothetical protein
MMQLLKIEATAHGCVGMTHIEHKYGTTKAQLLRKTNGAKSSTKKRSIPPKDIGS